MTRRSRLRGIGRLGAAAGSLLAVTLALGGSAGAHAGEPIRYEARDGNVVEKTYDTPMVAPDPYEFTLGVGLTPPECALVPFCTDIPIEFVAPPQAGERDDWIVYVTVGWDAVDLYEDDVIGTVTTSGLDLYLYTEEQVTDEEGNPQYNEDGSPQMEWVETARATGSGRPESFKLFRPEGVSHLVVTNTDVMNLEFTVTLEFLDASFSLEPLFGDEVPAPPVSHPSPPPSAAGTPSGSLAIDGGAVPQPAAAPVELAPVEVDDDFAGIAPTDLEDQLASDERGGSLFRREEFAPPEPVSGSTVALWMGLVPALLLAGVAALLVKFRPAALSFQLPKRS